MAAGFRRAATCREQAAVKRSTPSERQPVTGEQRWLREKLISVFDRMML